MSWGKIKLESLLSSRSKSLNPAEFPNEVFELYSIPGFDRRRPDIVSGSEIGSAKQILYPGDVLLSKIVPHIRRCWVVGHASPEQRQIGSGEWIVFRSKLVDSNYLSKTLVGDDFHQAFMGTVAGVGGSLLRARPAAVAEIEIPLPPLDEQRRIAAVLDKADALRLQRREFLQLIEKLLQSVFLDTFGDPVENSFGFPRCTIGDLLRSVNYGTSAKAGSDGGWPVLRMGNITYGGDWDFSSLKYMDLAPAEEQRYLVHQGEILFNRTNSKELVGKTAVYREQMPMAYAGYLIRCIVNDQADPEYISAFLNSAHGKRVLSSMCKSIVGMANINAKELQSISILKPPVELQKSFGNTVRAILSLRKLTNETSLKGDLLFASLQQSAFRGELDLGRLVLDSQRALEPEKLATTATKPKAAAPFLQAPENTEAALRELDDALSKREQIPWSADYFKYRILGAQPAPFSFGDVMQKAESVFDEPPSYDEIKDIILELLGQGGGRAILRQSFDLQIDEKSEEVSGSKEIVFGPAA